MSTLEYGTYNGPPLEGERLHRCLIDLQDSTVRKHHLKRPALSVADYEDLYARAMLVLLEKHPDARFPAPQAVVAWLDTTISRSAIDVLRRRNLGRETSNIVSVTDARDRENEPISVQPVDASPTPEQHVLLDEEGLTLKEFIASLDPEDRKISLLHLHPGSRMKLKQIAQALDLPATQVNTVLKRVDKRFSRYVALEVDAVCALRERDLTVWKRTGEMPAALKWHAKRCSTCTAKIEAARTEVYRSLLPFVGAVGLPATGSLGLLSRFYRSLGARPLVIRANEEVSRAGRAGAVGAGSGGALVTAKTAVTGAVVAIAAAGAGVAVVHSIGGAGPTHGTRLTGRITAEPTVTTRASGPRHTVTAPAKSTTRTTTTAMATRPNRTQRARPASASSSPIVSPYPRTTSTAPSTAAASASSTTTTSSPEPRSAPSSNATSSASKSNSATAKSNTSAGAHSAGAHSAGAHSGSSTTGGLPDLQQTEQQP